MTGALIAAIGLSLLSAVAYAVAAVVQERLAAASGVSSGTSSLLTSARGWSAICLNAGGALLHVAALAYASLTVVQPLGALSLVVALPVGAALAGRRVFAREWKGAAATVAGLVGVLIAANTGTPSRALTDAQTLLLLAITAVVIGVLARPRPAGAAGHFPGLRLAVAGGAAFAVASVLTQTVLLRLSDGGVSALLDPALGAALVAVAGLSMGGLLLSQAAYKHGLGAQLATLTIINPVVAATVGIGLLGQGAGLSAADIGTALFAAAVAAVGVVLLATPEGVRSQREGGQSQREGGRSGREAGRSRREGVRSRREAGGRLVRARRIRRRTRRSVAARRSAVAARCAEAVRSRRPAMSAPAPAQPPTPVSADIDAQPEDAEASRRGPLGVF